MQVLIRRKGITLTASWDGMAKPSDKQLHYFVRVKPDLAVVNDAHLAPVDVDVLSRVVQNTDRVFSMMQAPLSSVAVLRGAWGLTTRADELVDVGKTTLTVEQSPFVGMFSRESTHTGVSERVITRWTPNVLSHLKAVELVDQGDLELAGRVLSAVNGMPTLTLGSQSGFYYAMANNAQKATASAPAQNLLEHKVMENAEAQAVTQTVTARQRSVPLKAPLPAGALIQEQATSLNHAPAATDHRHMERVEVVDDPGKHDHWSRTPRPTHYVLDGMNPAHDPEVVRRDTPTAALIGYLGRSVRMTGERAMEGFLEAGTITSQEVRGYGKRNNIAQLGTNARSSGDYTHSNYYSSEFRAAGAFDGWSYGPKTSTSKKNITGVANEIYGNSAWRENYRYNQWIQVDFGQIVEGINGVRLGAPSGQNYSATMMMRYVSIQVSDNGSNWTTVTNFYTDYDTETYQGFTPVNARYVRIYGSNNHGHSSYMSMTHVEIYKA